MIYRFAAACALVLESLMAFHLVNPPLLHETAPLSVAGWFFIAAFALTELWEGFASLMHKACKCLHRLREHWNKPKGPP